MSSNKYAQSLHLEPRVSMQLAMALFLLHGAAMVVAVQLPLPAWGSLLIAAAILVNFYTTFSVHVLGRGRLAVISLVWDDEGAWTLYDVNGEEMPASLQANSYVHPYLIVLNFALQQGGRRTALLLKDSLDSQTHRKLLLRMRLEGDRSNQD